jgi:hypothetical protein
MATAATADGLTDRGIKVSRGATKFKSIKDPKMHSRFAPKPAYASDPDIMKLKREGATIKAYYELVSEEGVKWSDEL